MLRDKWFVTKLAVLVAALALVISAIVVILADLVHPAASQRHPLAPPGVLVGAVRRDTRAVVLQVVPSGARSALLARATVLNGEHG